MKWFLSIILFFSANCIHAATYYVDPSSTSATANGTMASPWKTLAQVNSNMALFQPGDQILFKRGQKFSGTLVINRSGTSTNPIVFGAYGTGADPLFWGTGSTIDKLIYLYNRSYITFYGLAVKDTTISATDRNIQAKIQRAFYIDGTSTGVLIRKCSIERVGVGAFIVGPSNTLDSCEISNMRLIRNTPTTVNANDDYGANPVVISSANNKITNNYFHDCWGNSYDYQYDGGAVEFYGNGSSNNFICYNTFYDCAGVVESGSGNGGTITGNLFAYNKMINNGSLFYINNGGDFAVTVTNMQFLNNVIVENQVNRLVHNFMGSMRSSSTISDIVIFKNNIFWLSTGIDVMRSSQFTGSQLRHENNVYRLTNNSITNFTTNASELNTTGTNIFTNTGATDPRSWNYTPVSGSPVVDFGQAISGMTRDFLGTPLSLSNAPDAGIIESNATATSTLVASATATTILCNGGTSTITVSATGGTAPYTGTGNYTVTAGTYTYTVRDAAGASHSVSITVTQPVALTASLSAGTITANGGTTSITVTASGGVGTYSYRLNSGVYQSSNVFSGVPAGTHTIAIQDGRGCTITRTITISQPSALTASASATSISCNGGNATVTVSATGGTAPYTGTGTFTVAAGTYTYTVRDAANASSSTTITVSQSAALTLTSGQGQIYAAGGTTTVNLTATGGTPAYTYNMNSGAYQSSSSFTAVPVGTHTFRVKDSKGCIQSKSVTISLTPVSPLTITLTPGTITCNGGSTSVQVAASGGVSPYSGTGSFLVEAGTYTYSVTDAVGNVESATITVSQPQPVNFTLSSGTISAFGGTTNITVTGTSGGSGTGFTYSLNNGTYQSSTSFSAVPAGTHTVTAKDSKGCTSSKTITINQPAATFTVSLVSKKDQACRWVYDGSITVRGDYGTTPYSFRIGEWGYGRNTTFSNLAPGTYTITGKDAANRLSYLTVTILSTTNVCRTAKGIETTDTEPVKIEKAVTIFPNPSASYFQVKLPVQDNRQRKLTVTDMQGRTIEQIQFKGQNLVRIGDSWKPGVYLISIWDGTERYQEKVIKTNP